MCSDLSKSIYNFYLYTYVLFPVMIEEGEGGGKRAMVIPGTHSVRGREIVKRTYRYFF